MTTTLERSLAKAHANANFMVADITTYRQKNLPVSLGSGEGGLVSSLNSLLGSEGRATNESQHNQGWVHTAVKLIAQRIAGQAVCVGRRSRKPTKGAVSVGSLVQKGNAPYCLKQMAGTEQIEPLESHPVLDVLKDPNDLMVLWSLMYVTACNLELNGCQFWWLYENDEGKQQIYPVPSHWVQPTQGQAFGSSWTVTPQGAFSGQVIVPGEQMAYFFYPDPADPLGSLSTLWPQIKAVEADEAILESNRQHFRNGIFPGLAIIAGRHPDVMGKPGERPAMTPEQRTQLLSAIESQFKGALNSNKPIVLDSLIEDIKQISQSAREMDFQNSGAYTKSRVMQGFGVNPILLGEIQGANRASAGVADDLFTSNTINPKIELLSQVMTAWLVPRLTTDDIVMWIEPAKPRDPDFTLQVHWMLSNNKAITVNELRALYGYPPLDGGDVLPTPDPGVVPPGSGGQNNPNNQDDGKSIGWNEERRKQLFFKNIAFAEKELKSRLDSFFLQQHASVTKALRDVLTNKANKAFDAGPLADSIFHVGEWDQKFRDLMREPLTVIAMRGALAEYVDFHGRTNSKESLAETLTVLERGLPSSVVATIKKLIGELLAFDYWKWIQETTKKIISKILSFWLGSETSEATKAMLKELDDALVGDVAEFRKRFIIDTESATAVNLGHYAEQMDLLEKGLIESRQWLTMFDSRVREPHANLEGVVVHGLELFDMEGYLIPYPGHGSLPAKLRCGCRCMVVSVKADSPSVLIGTGEDSPLAPVDFPAELVPVFAD